VPPEALGFVPNLIKIQPVFLNFKYISRQMDSFSYILSFYANYAKKARNEKYQK
jgi:hypothetical protein